MEWLDKVKEAVDRIKDFLENKTARYVLIGVIVLILILVLVGKSHGFSGVMVYEDKGSDRIVLETTNCKNAAVVAMLNPDVVPFFHAGTYVVTGNRVKIRERSGLPVVINGCWRAFPEHQAVLTVWEDGDVFPVPLSVFKPGDPSAKKTGLII